MVIVPSHGHDAYRCVDMGNYFDHEGQQVLVTSRELAEQYGHLVDVPIYVHRKQGDEQ
jgi:hypothetical protein